MPRDPNIDEDFFEDDIDPMDTCEHCSRDLNAEDGGGCPFCKDCEGIYNPGTEECDFCTYSDYCAKIAIEAYSKSHNQRR